VFQAPLEIFCWKKQIAGTARAGVLILYILSGQPVFQFLIEPTFTPAEHLLSVCVPVFDDEAVGLGSLFCVSVPHRAYIRCAVARSVFV